MNKPNIISFPVAYVLVRTDIPSMNIGKAMAQVHHAGVQMISKHANHKLVKAYLADGKKGNADGFATTIILAAKIDDINSCLRKAKIKNNCLSQAVVDPSYPFRVDGETFNWALNWVREHAGPNVGCLADNASGIHVTKKETTCAWFLGDRNDPEFKNLFEGLKLYE